MNFKKISIIGLGYVGLPLAVEFSKKYNVLGFDVNIERINELNNFFDRTNEIDSCELSSAIKTKKNSQKGLALSYILDDLKDSDIFIVTVPTPIDENNKPDLTPLKKASEMISKVLKKGNVVIYESTVYPGCTEEICVPILEKISKLKFNIDFFCGYSPERINPGDKERTLTNIKKIVSGSTVNTTKIINDLYSEIITAGTYIASSIKVAEAAKVIENTQRDINIAFVNELSKIFNLIGIDTNEVLDAAGSKWNFIKFKPGLVGGHCISVDPFYLTYKSIELGYIPKLILNAREINDGMGIYIANKFIQSLNQKNIDIKNSNILILGFTFKENCPDIRNTKINDIIKVLQFNNMKYDIVDPIANPEEVLHEYSINILSIIPKQKKYDGILILVAHDIFKEINFDNYLNHNSIIFDIKSILPKNKVDFKL